MQDHSLITTLVAATVLAFLLGFLAQRLRLPPIVGYMLAGVVAGPHTPGYVGDIALAQQLAEIGVVLLMFGVGLKISVKDLWETRRVALPGAVVQMATATLLGFAAARLIGFGLRESLIIGVSLSVASTVVLLRALEGRGMVDSSAGRLVVGWLVVEDIAIVLAIVALPALAATVSVSEAGAALEEPIGVTLTVTFVKIAAFIGLMTLIGGRVFPWFIVRVAHLRSRELLSLGTLALALGVAYTAYAVFDASFALGAFLAGVALNGTRLSANVAENSLPLRDTFAVLFFVAVGMLFDWHILLTNPGGVLLLVAIVVLGKGFAAWGIARLLGTNRTDSLYAAAALAQIGEFSFVLAGLGLALGVLSRPGHDLVLAAALISILLNPLLFHLTSRAAVRQAKEARLA
ncbi:MAG: cation:proton antiporter [Sphingomonadaceae bacterium]